MLNFKRSQDRTQRAFLNIKREMFYHVLFCLWEVIHCIRKN